MQQPAYEIYKFTDLGEVIRLGGGAEYETCLRLLSWFGERADEETGYQIRRASDGHLLGWWGAPADPMRTQLEAPDFPPVAPPTPYEGRP